MRARRRVVLAALPLAALAGCSGGSDDAGAAEGTVSVAARSWSGWTSPAPGTTPPAPVTASMPARRGATLTAPGLGRPVTFRVHRVSPQRVGLETSEALVERGREGGYSLDGATTRFELAAGRPLRLATPSTDAGVTFEVTLS